ncbi:hypothetical protein DLM_3718 [Aquitalea magnusonii]|uniref:Transmembrane protein n=1 Tax=Aquitalea magnusonii TaxID=332411 RepID=A0A3G9GNJ6_9NEIS|nr:hypothetical protein [Aquitalea magnusonii]BBF87302.1 hypothetical protein DLM_3718 [Aquitalea magnusonii]
MSPRAAGRLRLLAMLALCLLPLLAAWFSYRFLPPVGGKSDGEMLPTRPFAAASQQAWPRGRWVLVTQAVGACQQACRQRLFVMQQVHLALGEAAPRLRRVLLQDRPFTADGGVLRLPSPRLLAPERPGFYLIDPQGNQLLFYADTLPPERIIRELAMVLKINNGLG